MTRSFVAILLAIVLTASVQAEFTLGFRGGFNLTNMSEKVNGVSVPVDFNFKLGLQLGLVGEYTFRDVFAIQPSILFATQGTQVNFNPTIAIININYLQVPLNFLYKVNFGSVSLLLQAGPYLGFAHSGKIRPERSGFFWGNYTRIEFGRANNEMRRLDFGLGVGVGIQSENVQIGIGYNFGLANLSNINNTTTRNNGFALTTTIFLIPK